MKLPDNYTGVLLIDDASPPSPVRLPTDKKPILKQVVTIINSNLGKYTAKDPETIRIVSVLILLSNTEIPTTIYKLYRIYTNSVAGKLIKPTSTCRQSHTENPLIGMDNYLNTTCYLDALIISLFYSTTAFDYLLDNTADPSLAVPLQREIEYLKTMLRFIVNLIRAGEHVSIQIMYQLLIVLNALGCDIAVSGKQQDSVQMFEFLAESLSLPLLTLKLDIIHTGTLDVNDDLRLIGERALFISIPNSNIDGSSITLEECLNTYFNNSITVRRHLDQKKLLATSESAPELTDDPSLEINEYEKLGILKSSLVMTSPSVYTVSPQMSRSGTPISIVDSIPESIATPTESREISLSSPSVATFSPKKPFDAENGECCSAETTPSYQNVTEKIERQRTRSSTLVSVLNNVHTMNPMKMTRRSSSISNTEVSLPAWMYLQLLPYYTNPDVKLKLENHEEYYRRRQSRSKTIESITNFPTTTSTTDAALLSEKEAYFNTRFGDARPIVPICLKRYTWNERGKPIKITRQVSIPETISYPYFIAEDRTKAGYVDFKRSFDHKAPRGSFKLVLQSMVCHRGKTINSGHYVSITRRRPYTGDTEGEWIVFNDMLPVGEKTKVVTLQEAIDAEDPYILFYEIMEINDSGTRSNNNLLLPEGYKDSYWTRKPSVVSSMSESTIHEEPSSDAVSISKLNIGLNIGLNLGGLGISKNRKVADVLDEYYWYGNNDDESVNAGKSTASSIFTYKTGNLSTNNSIAPVLQGCAPDEVVVPEVHVMEVGDTHSSDDIGDGEVAENDKYIFVDHGDVDFVDDRNELHIIKSRGSTKTPRTSVSPTRVADNTLGSVDSGKSGKKILGKHQGKVKKLFKKVFS